ncbi:SET domain containing protein [Novymonas esmeraldas]|uniref:SET domain containing protein n=1 Tax=Novymonas esmeraldas TaxID=1808958 RepID=A0AAW0F5I7_9TRYP
MPRVRAARVAWYAGQELDAYLRQRAWHWTVRRNYALAADYCIRLLNRHPHDALGLVLGEVAGSRTSQDTFTTKCAQSLRECCTRRGASDAAALLRAALGASSASATAPSASPAQVCQRLPTADEVVAMHAELAEATAAAHTAGLRAQASADESLVVHNTESAEATALAVRRCSLRCASPPRAELLEPAHTTSGRGLYATRHIAARQCILTEAPLLVQRSDDTVCAHCLAPLSARSSSSSGGSDLAISGAGDSDAIGVACPHCEHETYCSTGCRDAAWTEYHACCCASRNPEMAEWSGGMRDVLRRGGGGGGGSVSAATGVGDSSSEARAALSCLAVAKLCAMATVQQRHPLSLPGLASLRGVADYQPATALCEIGALAVALSAALRQPHLYMEEVLSLFALLQTNELCAPRGIALYTALSMLNHSCDPNCAVVGADAAAPGQRVGRGPMEKQLVALRPIRDGEQLCVNYNANLMAQLSYADRQALCAQRHFTCHCPRCIRRE